MDQAKRTMTSLIDRVKGAAQQGAGCAQFCEDLFPEGAERTQCVRDGASHVPGNLCDACENDVSRICIQPSGERTCCERD
jgi:hypothetical protein